MNTAELIALIEQRFSCRQGIFTNRCQTGEKYVEIGVEIVPPPHVVSAGPFIPGVKRSLSVYLHYETENEACEAILKALGEYHQWWQSWNEGGMPPVLYWRNDRHITWHPNDGPKPRDNLGTIRCRLVLSNRPVICQLSGHGGGELVFTEGSADDLDAEITKARANAA